MNQEWLLLDTSGLFCALDRSERRHARASQWLLSPHWKMVHNYILAELIALAGARGLPMRPVLEFSSAILTNLLVKVVWVDEALHQAALALLENRADKRYSLCDAVSFVLMRTHSISQALTTDKHFVQEGFVRLLED